MDRRGGRALDLACGEGRNAIWLARRGFAVTAADFSSVAIGRARELAERASVEVDFLVEDVVGWRPEPGAYDLVLISYLQIPMAGFVRVLDRAAAALRPSGQLFMIGHAERNLVDGVGGPSDVAVLWNPVGLAEMLEELGLTVSRCDEVLRPVAGREDGRAAVDVLARATLD